MKEFFKMLLIEPFQDNDWLGYIMGILLWIITLVIVIGLFWFTVWIVDSSFLPIKQGIGIVTNKYIIPAHTTTNYIMTGKVLIPIISYHSVSYNVDVSINDLIDDISMCEYDWSILSIDQKVTCKYTNGRILNSLYIQEISWKNNY